MGKALAFVLALGSVSPDTTLNVNIFVLGQVVEIVELDTTLPIAFINVAGIGANVEFLDLPMDIQEVSIAHELGHLNLGHLETDGWLERGKYIEIFGTADPREVDADLFASDIVGRGRMLYWFGYYIDFCGDNGFRNCLIEALLRREMFEGRYCR